jgi:hypothetical protein
MDERLRILGRGTAFTLCSPVNKKGKCSVEKELGKYERANQKGYERIMTLLMRVADEGVDGLDTTLVRPLGDGLLELKERRGLFRITGFYDKNRRQFIILNSAWKKKPGKHQDEKIKAARRAMEEYHRQGGLPLEDE